MLDNILPFFILIVNEILSLLIHRVVSGVKMHTHSEQSVYLTVAIFLAQFFNTAIGILLAYSNLKEYNIPYF
jgi:hypothetical protein